MRNWNKISISVQLADGFGFDRTYEELKHPYVIQRTMELSAVLIVPMRNWNTAIVMHSATEAVFWSYLWGIETQKNGKPGYKWGGFDRTYEELKPPECHSRRTWTKRFDRTYEELKLRMMSAVAKSFASFDRTYEELKQNGIFAAELDIEVLIVPMRNWNSYASSTGIRLTTFWSYLWGIETASFLRLLLFFQCFDRTYEELKPGRLPDRCSTGKWFWSYLWGIETGSAAEAGANHPAFWSYLWGIETSCRNPNASMRFGFDRTYEELKLVNNPDIKAMYATGFDRTYEELKHLPQRDRVCLGIAVLIVPMRNWNPARMRRCAVRWRRFDRTYEELKLCTETAVAGGQEVLIVPMRNWNQI